MNGSKLFERNITQLGVSSFSAFHYPSADHSVSIPALQPLHESGLSVGIKVQGDQNLWHHHYHLLHRLPGHCHPSGIWSHLI